MNFFENIQTQINQNIFLKVMVSLICSCVTELSGLSQSKGGKSVHVTKV